MNTRAVSAVPWVTLPPGPLRTTGMIDSFDTIASNDAGGSHTADILRCDYVYRRIGDRDKRGGDKWDLRFSPGDQLCAAAIRSAGIGVLVDLHNQAIDAAEIEAMQDLVLGAFTVEFQ